MKIINLQKVKKKIKQKLLPAVNAIKNGDLVVIPTETVYGLAADCFNPAAVNKIFLVKKRPYTDPLIVHISEFCQITQLVKSCPQEVNKIITAFWPGPLTVILPKNKNVPDIVTAGLDTVAVRMPEDEIARMFINMCQTPLVAPSANIFSRVSATELEHIIEDFHNAEEVKYVIYTGRTKYGVESTVIDCTEYPFKVLRYGAIPVEEIVNKTRLKVVEQPKSRIIKSPGMFKKHYSPVKPAFIVPNVLKFLNKLNKNELKNYVIVCSDDTEEKIRYKYKDGVKVIPYGNEIKKIAQNLYFCLRLADSIQSQYIIIEPVKPAGLGKTIMDRITKATSGRCLNI